jgi:hypothetical protein
MPTIEQLTPEMFAEALNLLRRLNPAMPGHRWQSTCDGRWQPDAPHGCVLREQGRLVGILGMLFSERNVGGRNLRLCNLHSWYVEPEHRASSLLLLRQALALRDCTLTDFSASPRVVDICRRLGFRTLDDAVVAIPALPWPGAGDAVVEELGEDGARAAEVLDAEGLRIFRDHCGIDCVQLWMRDDQGGCHIVCSIQRHGRFGHCNLHHIGDRALFVRRHAAFRAWLRRRGLRHATTCSRLLAGVRVPLAMRLRSNIKLYRPVGDVPAEAIDALYSEVPLLKLPVEIAAIGRLSSATARWLPGARGAAADD